MTVPAFSKARPREGAGEDSTPPPPPPKTLDDIGITAESLTDLILKTLHQQGSLTGFELARRVGVGYMVLDDLVAHLREHQWVEVRSSQGATPVGYRLALSRAGKDRAREAVARSPYTGPAPVSLDEFRVRVERQSIRGARATRDGVKAAFSDLVISDDAMRSLGPALASGSSFFLFGPPGNGKTAIATRLGAVLGDPIYIPYAIEVDGEVISVYDAAQHRRVDRDDDEDVSAAAQRYDRRYVRVERPVVITSGELHLADLDLRFDPVGRVYRAPPQLRAMGGALVLDDFGRQRAAPAEIFSRWIFPLEYGIDYLTLHTGFKFELPFDCLLVFASNLDPKELAEEAFLRRIQYKVHVPDPTRDAYTEIFSREVARVGLPCDAAAVDWVYSAWYEGRGIPPRGCHPRDLLRLVQDYARYNEREPRVDVDALDFACSTYFDGRTVPRQDGTEVRT